MPPDPKLFSDFKKKKKKKKKKNWAEMTRSENLVQNDPEQFLSLSLGRIEKSILVFVLYLQASYSLSYTRIQNQFSSDSSQHGVERQSGFNIFKEKCLHGPAERYFNVINHNLTFEKFESCCRV